MARLHPMFYLLLGLVALLSVMVIAPFWAYVFAGLLLGQMGYPLFKRFRRRFKRKGTAAGLTLLIVVLAIVLPLGFVGYKLVLQATSLAQGLTSDEAVRGLDRGLNFTRATVGWPPAGANETGADALLQQIVPQAQAAFISWLPSVATFIASFALGVFVCLFVTYYVLKDGDKLIAWVEEAMPLEPTTERRLWEEIRLTLDAVVMGQLLTAGVQGVLAGIGFWIFGVPAPVFWGFASAVVSPLPLMGPPMIWVPAALFLLATGHPIAAVGLFLWGLVMISGLDNFLKPRFITMRSGMHPTLALLGAIGGLVAFGFMGFVVGPLILALFVALVHAYMQRGRDLGATSPPPPTHSADTPGHPYKPP